MLQIESVTKYFGSNLALKNINLQLDAGRTHVLLGSSGSGKTTLLRALLGLIPVDEGRLTFNGQPLAELTGYVPQSGGLFPHLTARENISIVARARDWPAARTEARIAELAPLFSLEENLFARKPAQLSGGQRQRVALMRAALTDPPVLLLDEPLGSLDPLVRADLQAELKEIFGRLKKTVVFVTHDIGEAGFLADNIVLIHEGRVIQQGRLHELRDHPAEPFVTRFLNAQRLFDRGAGR